MILPGNKQENAAILIVAIVNSSKIAIFITPLPSVSNFSKMEFVQEGDAVTDIPKIVAIRPETPKDVTGKINATIYTPKIKSLNVPKMYSH